MPNDLKGKGSDRNNKGKWAGVFIQGKNKTCVLRHKVRYNMTTDEWRD